MLNIIFKKANLSNRTKVNDYLNNVLPDFSLMPALTLIYIQLITFFTQETFIRIYLAICYGYTDSCFKFNFILQYKLLHAFRAHYLADTYKRSHTNFKSCILESSNCNFLWPTSCCPCPKVLQLKALPLQNIVLPPRSYS